MANENVSNRQYRKKNKKLLLKICAILVLIVAVTVAGCYKLSRTYFGRTAIQGVDCSWLTVDETIEKLEDSIGETHIEFIIDGRKYETTYKKLGITVKRESVEQLLKSQDFFGQNEFSLENGISVNKEKIIDFLNDVLNLQEGNIVQPENAYIRFDGTNFVIEKEVLGNHIDYDKAYSIIAERLTKFSENQSIDLTTAMQFPQVISTDKALINECDRLNSILSTVITIKLMDGSTYTIDKNVMKNWVIQDGKSFTFNLEENVTKFVDGLIEAANNVTEVQIDGTDVGYVTMPAFEERIPKVIRDETINFIVNKLENAESYTGKPVYDKDPVTENLTDYVEIDISRQRAFMYLDRKCIVDTPIVTGNISVRYYTPTGVFYLDNKVRNTVLRGTNRDGSRYASPVKYWMPFYKGFGMHDASWRSEFGDTIYEYNGSHGCINVPENQTATVYDNISYEMPIFIYESVE